MPVTPAVASEVAGPAPSSPKGSSRAERDRGVVVVWFALSLTLLLGLTGFATDLAFWYLTSSRAQNAADAAALAGVVFLPGDLPQARAVATKVAGFHGETTVTANQVGPNQLRVVVERRVPTFFVRALGMNEVIVRQAALAEYEQPVAMGSPDPRLGNDPEAGHHPQFWLNVAGSMAYKSNGDQYLSKNCGPPSNTSDHNCSTATTPNNTEYSTNGYFFGARGVAGQPLRIQMFDPIYAPVGNTCGSNMPTTAQLNALIALPGSPTLPAAYYSDALTRYAGGATPWCSGDVQLGPSSSGVMQHPPPETTVIVRAPDDTDWIDTDNPVVCTQRFRGFTLGNGSSPATRPSVYQLLHPSDGVFDSEAVINPNDSVITFAEAFRRWVTVCDIPSAAEGEYIIQIRTNASPLDPLLYDPSRDAHGHNRFSLRAGQPVGASGIAGTGSVVWGRGRLPIFANTGATAFQAARLLPGGSGRVLEFAMFDMGDADNAGTLRFRPPADSNLGAFADCSFRRSDGAALSTDASTCRLLNVSAASGYNGRVVWVQIPIPNDYTCNQSSPSGCWVTVEPQFAGGGVNDATTWSASMLGTPVRLIQ